MISLTDACIIAMGCFACGAVVGAGIVSWWFAAAVAISCAGIEAWKRWC